MVNRNSYKEKECSGGIIGQVLACSLVGFFEGLVKITINYQVLFLQTHRLLLYNNLIFTIFYDSFI